jgi:hypothetical protein
MKNWILLPFTLLAFTCAQAADLPPQGMSMAKVLKHYGAPVKKSGPVGKPPITRWIYPDHTVVFEYKHVVQSVEMVNDGKPAASATPAPDTAPAAPNEATINVEVQKN